MNFNLTLIGQSIAMVVFVWFCMKYIWPHLLGAIEERQEQIEKGLAAADRGEEALVRAREEAEVIISDARQQATTILNQANQRANEIVADGKTSGEKERERQLTAAAVEIEQETSRAREELRADVSAVALAGAQKILAREIDASTHEDILGQLAKEL